jgi:hypothetical protein
VFAFLYLTSPPLFGTMSYKGSLNGGARIRAAQLRDPRVQ